MGKIERRGLWIAGESVSGEQSRWFATMNPATNEVICEVAEAGDEDVDSGADCLKYCAGQASSLQGEYQQLNGAFSYTRPESLGVCAGIGALNYPIQIAC